MNCWFKYILSVAFLLFSLSSIVKASQLLYEELQQGKKVAIFNINDCFADADSIQAFIESLLLSSQHKDQITQYFVTDDEANPDTVQTVAQGIKDQTCLIEEANAPIHKHYLSQLAYQENAEPSQYAFRVQDTAVILFSLADRLGINIQVVQGEISTNPSYNPYFGNFGRDYTTDQDQQYLRRIHRHTGSKAVIDLIKQEMVADKSIYILNGGSFRLLSDIQEIASHLLPRLDVTVMGFRQQVDFPPHKSSSWNEGIDMDATTRLVKFASSVSNPQFGAFRIVDSNTGGYGLICDGTLYPVYQEYMSQLQSLISAAAYQNLLDAEGRHKVWSAYTTRLTDPIVVYYAFGLVSIPCSQGKLVKNEKGLWIRSTQQDGFPAIYPDLEGKHPFSYPSEQSSAGENPEYTEQYKGVGVFRDELKRAHTKSRKILSNIF